MTIDAEENQSRPLRILLVEDNYGDVILTRRTLQQLKVMNEVVVAETGEEALSMLRKEEEYAQWKLPDIILIDLNLPGINGNEVLATIKSISSLDYIPVFILSSSRAEQDVAQSYNLQANDYILKPVSMGKFLEVSSPHALVQFQS